MTKRFRKQLTWIIPYLTEAANRGIELFKQLYKMNALICSSVIINNVMSLGDSTLNMGYFLKCSWQFMSLSPICKNSNPQSIHFNLI